MPEEEMDAEVERSFALSDLIAKVKYTGTSVYATGQIIFICDVVEVYKGDTSLAGKQISYVAEDMNITAKFELSSGSYVNYMKPDGEYLIFGTQLAGLLKGLPDNLYFSSGPWFITYFSFAQHNNELVTLEPLTARGYEEYLGFMAKDYPDNEFFVTTDEALHNVLELKKCFLKS